MDEADIELRAIMIKRDCCFEDRFFLCRLGNSGPLLAIQTAALLMHEAVNVAHRLTAQRESMMPFKVRCVSGGELSTKIVNPFAI